MTDVKPIVIVLRIKPLQRSDAFGDTIFPTVPFPFFKSAPSAFVEFQFSLRISTFTQKLKNCFA